MQSMRMTCWLAGLAMLMAAGCASSPTLTGQWYSDKLPEGGPGVPAQMLLVINEDQTFIATGKDAEGQPVLGVAGVWEQQSPKQWRLDEDETGKGSSSVIVQLLDEDTLLGTADGVAIEFRRVE